MAITIDEAFISSAVTSNYAAIYYPWIQIYDAYAKAYINVPPSGAVTSVYCNNDGVANAWAAPAGGTRGKINFATDVERKLSDGDVSLISSDENIINPILKNPNFGILVFGQRTAQRVSSALDRVNVRRLMNLLKKTISASTAYFTFDQNDEFSWNKWVDMVEPKIQSIKDRRGVYDFKIIMDSTIVTESNIENYTMPGQVQIKPTRTAEFIPLSFMIMPDSAVFNE
jgi:phage tail sheath protein FI